jgi:hypothetical protein
MYVYLIVMTRDRGKKFSGENSDFVKKPAISPELLSRGYYSPSSPIPNPVT